MRFRVITGKNELYFVERGEILGKSILQTKSRHQTS